MTFNSRTSTRLLGKSMELQEARWEIMRALLEGFPSLKKRTIEYLNNQ
jgi:hypothetical protein